MNLSDLRADVACVVAPAGRYLCAIFLMTSSVDLLINWQYDFFEPASGTISSFRVEKHRAVAISSDTPISSEVLLPLTLPLVLISPVAALATLLLQFEQGEQATQYILVLQQQETGPVWRVTATTVAFSFVHVVVDAVSGEIISSGRQSAFSLGSG